MFDEEWKKFLANLNGAISFLEDFRDASAQVFSDQNNVASDLATRINERGYHIVFSQDPDQGCMIVDKGGHEFFQDEMKQELRQLAAEYKTTVHELDQALKADGFESGVSTKIMVYNNGYESTVLKGLLSDGSYPDVIEKFSGYQDKMDLVRGLNTAMEHLIGLQHDYTHLKSAPPRETNDAGDITGATLNAAYRNYYIDQYKQALLEQTPMSAPKASGPDVPHL